MGSTRDERERERRRRLRRKKELSGMRHMHWREERVFPDHHNCSHCKEEHEFTTNYIRTTKYTFWNFLPQNLFEQFQKAANVYFLIIAILSFFNFSPKTPLVSVVPLLFVLSVTSVKEGVEDYHRYLSDIEINNSKVMAFRDKEWRSIAWTDVSVGDMLRIVDGGYFPADMVLIQSSARQGICNIETSNLDGETNLKIKQAVAATYEIEAENEAEDFPKRFRTIIESDAPNEKMDKMSWKGNFVNLQGRSKKVPLTMTQMLLRGCTLRNTKWIVGIVIFTGLDTKLMQQNKTKKIKRSHVERTVDSALYVIFAIQGSWCIFGSVAYALWLRTNATAHWYLPFVIQNIDRHEEAGVGFFTFVVLLDLLVPISLYVSMELVKFSQAWFIDQDLSMFYEVFMIPAHSHTSNLNEELGQIQYIFSDKTGTLTRNMMEFLRCSVGGIVYGPGEEKKAGEDPKRLAPKPGIPPFPKSFRFADKRLLNNLLTKHETYREIDEFLLMLAICNSVIPEFPDCDEDHVHALVETTCDSPVKYQAASPDELALVLAASEHQYYMHYREPVRFRFRRKEISGQRIHVNVLGKQLSFDIFETIEFSSSRKRMSVLFLDPRDGQIKIYCKGADNVIRERCNKRSLARHWKVTEKHLTNMASEGLRTLVCAYRVIDPEVFDDWYMQHQQAKSSMKNRKAEIQASAAIVERDLTLLGATAVEDRLQDGVPGTIERLAMAGIKIWVLTGDKVETAINIGRSCRLLTRDMQGPNLLVIDIDESMIDERAKVETIEALDAAAAYIKSKDPFERDHIGIVVSGKALGYVFPIRKLNDNKEEIIPEQHVLEEEARLQQKFLGICSVCKAVVCCRMSPKQKSQVVMLVRKNTTAITLAVGDGANDVAMIESAHVGVGIEGLEGKQAVMASDYSVGQFRYLTPLLLLHGAWDYRRLSTLVLYSFYKNVTITMTQIWFQFFTGYSGTIFFDAESGSLYNMMFTAFPVLALAIFDRPMSRKAMLKYPGLYKVGPANEHFNLKLLLGYIFEGTCHSLVLFFFSVFAFNNPTLPNGTDNDQWTMATAMFTAAVVLVNIKVALLTSTWVVYTAPLLFASVASWFVWMLMYSGVQTLNGDMFWVFYRLCKMGNFWFVVLVAPAACIVPGLAWQYLRQQFFFTRSDIVQEREAGFKVGPDMAYKAGSSAVGMKVKKRRKKRKGNSGAAARASSDYKPVQGSWKRMGERVKGDHLGYVPYIEDETGDTFVMGQSEFLSRYLVTGHEKVVNLD